MANTGPGPGPQMSQTRHLGGRVVTIWRQRYLRDELGPSGAAARVRAAGQEDGAASRTSRGPAGARCTGSPAATSAGQGYGPSFLKSAHVLMEAT
jgi:hypothetical protein